MLSEREFGPSVRTSMPARAVARDDILGRSETAFADELAWCLARFLDGTVDEPTLERARRLLGSGPRR